VDLIGPLPETPRGHTAILVFVDRLSKYVHCVPTAHKLIALGFAHLFVTHIFANHSMPRYVISDRGAQWNNHFWKHLARALGVKHHMSTAYHPQTDGQTERTNKTIEEVLRNYVESSVQRDWDLWLPLAQFAINNSWQESIQTTPFVLNAGAHPMVPSQLELPVDSPAATDFTQRLTEVVNCARESMSIAQQRQAKNANCHRRPKTFQVNDLVMFHSGHFTFAQSDARKLMPRYLGPFRVTEVKRSGAVKLDLPNYGNWQRIHPVRESSLHVTNTTCSGLQEHRIIVYTATG
jgi:hypothetical protein